MTSSFGMHGVPTSDVEVTNVSANGLWVLSHGKESFLPYDDFPWFRNAAISDVLDVREVRPGHLRWPRLDIDLDVKSIESPERYPLIAR